MAEKVFVIGATGNVGRELLSQVYRYDTDTSRHRNPTLVVGVASSTSYIYRSDGLPEDVVMTFSRKETSGIAKQNSLQELCDVIRKSEEPVRVIDVTSASDNDMLALHKTIVSEGRHSVVTSNKNPLTICDTKTFRFLTAEPRRYGFRCSVMAGADTINHILNLVDTSNPVISILGSFSGTLAYVASELEKGKKFSEVVSLARERGYTEPHPATDLSGNDVAKKILILARTAGYDINLSDIAVTPFIPREYLEETEIVQFLANLKLLDPYFEEKTEEARRCGQKLRYLAEFTTDGGSPKITVGLQVVSAESTIGSLSGTLNKIIIKTNVCGNGHYSIESPGAGLEITASNIRTDMLQMIDNRVIAYPK